MGNIRCGRGVSVVFIATHYSARYAALSAFALYAAAKKSHNCVQATSLMTTNQKRQRKCRLIAKKGTLGVPTWRQKLEMAKLRRHLGRDTVLLRSFASSSLDLFASRCGVVACRFRSLSISPSLSCSIAVIVNRSLLSPRARAVYTRTYACVRRAV